MSYLPTPRALHAQVLKGNLPLKYDAFVGVLVDRVEAAVADGRLPFNAAVWGRLLAVLFPEHFIGGDGVTAPVSAAPGTPAKLAALAGRLARREPLFHPADGPTDPRAGVRPRPAWGAKGGCPHVHAGEECREGEGG